ncbi:hypothetical protein CRG98_017972 [Punica granatum]|uniref:Uncharacterized protein n=1 Tax=Punica granatum TaxID=22663 RepID=A0A2I0JZ47_PUNGR|nr:hypothetical protein CRG98_017972 [Punica granatum]
MGDGHPRAAAAAAWGKWGRHDDSDHGTVQGKRRWVGAVAWGGQVEAVGLSRGLEAWLGWAVGLIWLGGKPGEARGPIDRASDFRGPFPGAVYLPVDWAPGSPVGKGVCESSGVSRLKQDASETRPDVSLVTLAPGGIFRVPHWAPFDAPVIW